MIQAVLEGQPGPAHNIVALNAGAAVYVAGVAKTMKAGAGGGTSDQERRRQEEARRVRRLHAEAEESLSILERIVAAKRAEISAAKRPVDVKSAPPVRDFIAALRRTTRGDRGDQARESVEGRAAPGFRSRGDRQELRGSRRGVHVGPHRSRVLPGRARASLGRARRLQATSVAQGLHHRSLPGGRHARSAPIASFSSSPASMMRSSASSRRSHIAWAWRCWLRCTTPRSSSAG